MYSRIFFTKNSKMHIQQMSYSKMYDCLCKRLVKLYH